MHNKTIKRAVVLALLIFSLLVSISFASEDIKLKIPEGATVETLELSIESLEKEVEMYRKENEKFEDFYTKNSLEEITTSYHNQTMLALNQMELFTAKLGIFMGMIVALLAIIVGYFGAWLPNQDRKANRNELELINNKLEATKAIEEDIKKLESNIEKAINQAKRSEFLAETSKLFAIAYSLTMQEKFDDALEMYNEMIKRFEVAIEDDDKLELSRDYYLAYLNKARMLDSLGRKEESIKMYDKVIKLKPNDAKLYNDKANVLYSLKRYDEAIGVYDKSIKLDSENKLTYYNKGISFLRLKKFKSSIEMFNKALTIDPHYTPAIEQRKIASKKKWRDV